MFRKALLALLLAAVALITTTIATPTSASAATTTTDVITYVGVTGADTFTQSLNGVLYTEDQIGLMADRILATEGEIADMSDRIVYVTEVSQFNFIEVVYLVTSISSLGVQDGNYLYDVTLLPVAALPTGW